MIKQVYTRLTTRDETLMTAYKQYKTNYLNIEFGFLSRTSAPLVKVNQHLYEA